MFSIYFNHTSVGKRIVDTESVEIHDFINRSEAVFGCFAINVLLDSLRIFLTYGVNFCSASGTACATMQCIVIGVFVVD